MVCLFLRSQDNLLALLGETLPHNDVESIRRSRFRGDSGAALSLMQHRWGLTEVAILLEIVHDDRERFLDRLVVGIDGYFGAGRLFVRRRDAGEFGNLAGAGFGVETFGVAL